MVPSFLTLNPKLTLRDCRTTIQPLHRGLKFPSSTPPQKIEKECRGSFGLQAVAKQAVEYRANNLSGVGLYYTRY